MTKKKQFSWDYLYKPNDKVNGYYLPNSEEESMKFIRKHFEIYCAEQRRINKILYGISYESGICDCCFQFDQKCTFVDEKLYCRECYEKLDK